MARHRKFSNYERRNYGKACESVWKSKTIGDAIAKSLDTQHINLNIGEQNMVKKAPETTGNWTVEDVAKLKENSTRPVMELIRIFKFKYSDNDIRSMLARMAAEMKIKKQNEGRCKLTDDEFKIYYDNRNLSPDVFLKKYPEIAKKTTKSAVTAMLSFIRREIEGKHTKLGLRYYTLLKNWYNSQHSTPLPPRGSVASRVYNSKNSTKKSKAKQAYEEIKEPETIIESKEIEASKPETLAVPHLALFGGVPNSDGTYTPIMPQLNEVPAQQEPRVTAAFSTAPNLASSIKYGLMVADDCRLVVDNEEQLSGAEKAYRSLGFFNIKKVKFMTQELQLH